MHENMKTHLLLALLGHRFTKPHYYWICINDSGKPENGSRFLWKKKSRFQNEIFVLNSVNIGWISKQFTEIVRINVRQGKKSEVINCCCSYFFVRTESSYTTAAFTDFYSERFLFTFILDWKLNCCYSVR